MPAAPEKLTSLRRLLAERFPATPRTRSRVLPTGIAALDQVAGGLPLSAVTEIVCAAPSCGGALFLQQLLAVTRAAQQRVALIDSADSFDPGSHPADLLAHLLWVRCPKPAAALQAADLLTRDANLGVVILDLRRGAENELRRTPSTFWYRLQRAVETTDLALVIATPHIAIPSAQLRLMLDVPHGFDALERNRPQLITDLVPKLNRQRFQIASVG